MKRLLIILSFIGTALLVPATLAFAAHPHFEYASAARTGTLLLVNYQESGLGKNPGTHYLVSANVDGTFTCTDAAGVVTTRAALTAPVTGANFSAHNGTAILSNTLDGAAVLVNPCPAGTTHALATISYSGAQVVDTTNTITQTIPGVF